MLLEKALHHPELKYILYEPPTKHMDSGGWYGYCGGGGGGGDTGAGGWYCWWWYCCW